MAADPSYTTRYFTITYPSHNGEKPFGFLVHNKGLFFTLFYSDGYGVIYQINAVGSGDESLKSQYPGETSTTFECKAYKYNSIETGIEIAPLYLDMFNI